MSLQENLFGKVRGRVDTAAMGAAVDARRVEMLRAMLAMSDDDLTAFCRDFNEMTWAARRAIRVEFAKALGED